jgi:pentatricopeptide repeat protein
MCPSYGSIGSLRPVSLLSRQIYAVGHNGGPRPSIRSRALSRTARHSHTAACFQRAATESTHGVISKETFKFLFNQPRDTTKRSPGQRAGPPPGKPGHAHSSPPQPASTPGLTERALLRSWFPYPELYRADAQTINSVLPKLVSQDKRLAFVKRLLGLKAVKPTAAHYNVLLAAHTSNQKGSAVGLCELREAMRVAGVHPNADTFHILLRALAIHPDYLARSAVLKEMKEGWVELLPEGWWSVALGLLRDGQIELAVDNLEHLMQREAGSTVPTWVYDIFVYRLISLHHFDEVTDILRVRLENDSDVVPMNVWYFLLDEASRAYHHEGTRYAWDRMVRTKEFIHPSDGMLLNVLNTAARHADANLATQALQRIAARSKLAIHHYDALLDCYAWKGDVSTALEVLCIMEDAGVGCEAASTRTMLQCLRQKPDQLDLAIEKLFQLGGTRDVPMAAFNMVIEALCDTDNYDKALALYRRVRQVCHGGPAASTFMLLWARCDRAQVAHFLAAEMAAFRFKADGFVFDRLVYAHALDGDLQTAFRYLSEMGESTNLETAQDRGQEVAAALLPSSPALRAETIDALIVRCSREGDERAAQLCEEAKLRHHSGLQQGDQPMVDIAQQG